MNTPYKIKHFDGTADERIVINVCGPRTLLRKSMEATANTSQTWYEFLQGKCGIQLDMNESVIVCSTSYSPNVGRGWMTTDLHERIQTFLSNFRMKKYKYSVRLQLTTTNGSRNLNISDTNFGQIFNDNPVSTSHQRKRHRSSAAALMRPESFASNTSRTNDGIVIDNIRSLNEGTMPLLHPEVRPQPNPRSNSFQRESSVPPKKRRYSGVPPGGFAEDSNIYLAPLADDNGNHRALSTETRHGKRGFESDSGFRSTFDFVDMELLESNQEIINRPITPHVPTMENFNFENQNDNDDDLCSEGTAAEVEEEEMRSAGIQIKAMQHLVRQRIKRFGNSFLLKAQHELKMLQKKNSWTRNVQRAPLCCHMIEEILKF